MSRRLPKSMAVTGMLVTSRAVHVDATTLSPLSTGADTVAIGVFEDEGVAHDLPGGELAALLESGEARRAFKRIALTHHDGRRVLLVGLGPRAKFDAERARVAAAVAHARARECETKVLCWELPHDVADDIPAALVTGTVLAAYRFTRYKPAPAGEKPVERLLVSAHHGVASVVREAGVIAQAQNRARDLANTPGNDLTPGALAQHAFALAERHPTIAATAMDESQIRYEGMGAFAAVAQGSAQDARLIRLDYSGPGASGGRPLALIGKGVTFDTGGIALKQRAGMEDMKFDMSGGAAVIETIAALAELEAPVLVLGLVGATENMPGSQAVKPGDIVRALDGTTIEVNNPDAEGRLVLADCICLARREGCQRLVDIATLTVIDVALGSTYAGLMSNDDGLAAAVAEAGAQSGELVWRLPLHPEYAAMVEGRYAQLTNRTRRRVAMPITAAEFLHHFAGDVPWAHLDVAGTSWDAHKPYLDSGASGFGVRLLTQLARDHA
jgi:leucyl aminopeptidase